jgi:hypothetical protein
MTMAYKVNEALAALALAAIKDALDGGFLYVFNGPEPLNGDDPLDMATDHTQVAQLSLGNDGVTGLEFDPVTGNLLVKVPADVWRGTIAFEGADSGAASLPATFVRLCAAGDDGRDAGSGPRLQASAGGPSSAATFKTGTEELTDNGTNTVTVSIFTLALA